MRACIFDWGKISKWRKYAIENEISLEETLRISRAEAKFVGDREEHILYLDDGYRFVFSIENTPSLDNTSIYKIRRLSGSVTRCGVYPSIEVMRMLCTELGFGDFKNCHIRINETDIIPNVEINEVISIKKNEK